MFPVLLPQKHAMYSCGHILLKLSKHAFFLLLPALVVHLGDKRCQASEVLKLIRLWKRVNFKLTLSLRESSVLSQCLLDYPATINHLTILFNTSEQIIKCENTFWQKPSYEKSKARRGPEWAKCSTYPLRHLWHLAPCGTWKKTMF